MTSEAGRLVNVPEVNFIRAHLLVHAEVNLQ